MISMERLARQQYTDEIGRLSDEIEQLRAALSWLANHEPQLVDEAMGKFLSVSAPVGEDNGSKRD